MSFLKSVLEDKKMAIMSWMCFIVSVIQMFTNPSNWELITLLLSFSFFPNIMKEFIVRKYNLKEVEKGEEK